MSHYESNEFGCPIADTNEGEDMSNINIVDDFEHGIPMTDENMAQFGWVKVVRCRDCKHAIDNGKEGNADYCGRPDGNGGYLLFGVEPDGYCKWGERK